MVKLSEKYTVLSVSGVIGTGTPLSFKNTEKATVQVDLGQSAAGTTTVLVQGSNAATSTGAYVTLGTVTLTTTSATAATSSQAVDISGAYAFVRANCTTLASTAATTTAVATVRTQGEAN